MPALVRFACASLALALPLATTFPAKATAPAAAPAASAPARTPYPAIDPAFSRPDPGRVPGRAVLRAFLVTKKSIGHANTFCFVQRVLDRPDTTEPGTSVLSMIWYEGESIHRINRVRPGQRYAPGTMDPETEGRMLAHATGTVDLQTDVVPTDADIGTSTFLVSRPWVDHLFAQCKRVGTKVRIPAFKPPTPSQ
ncbi:hypothetical protein [Paracidovorax anthurii]|uniref:Uncharacterized protein n=1 Tax=Paracidovorax anthurii TaxID=78229 RepID=A0A328Z7M8_9BURK|nr:hypothetical protein [Paracidovorax anthurii]RAR80692.1 hypothetical protein AX018_102250 [Paracidovorax anthurii]